MSLAVLGVAACGDDSPPPGGDADASTPTDTGSTEDLGPTPPPVPPPPVDAGTPVDADRGPCDAEGMTRTVPCGRCGLAAQTCTGGRWSEPSDCLSEGECAAGEIDRDPPTCGDRVRICDEMCSWRPFEGTFTGACMPGDTRIGTSTCPRGGYSTERCTRDCETWEQVGGCIDGCSRPPNPSRTGADPVCIPAGPFVLGSTEYPNASPVQTVMLSEFYVDRYLVTRQRIFQCHTTDPTACFSPVSGAKLDQYEALHLVEARQFCEWDGGQLIDEFQWEKAGRGFAPDDRRHSWGDIDITGPRRGTPMEIAPEATSPFGVRHIGLFLELTRSYPIVDYSTIALTDPFYEATDDFAVLRGHGYVVGPSADLPNTVSRREVWPMGPNEQFFFRCAY